MFENLLERRKQGHRTAAFPARPPTLPDRYPGLPIIKDGACPEECRRCVDACPTDAIAAKDGQVSLDLGRCLFCVDCVTACPEGAISFSGDHRMATRAREDLILDPRGLTLARRLEERTLSLFGRSLKLRQVSASGCNACEADVNVLNTLVFDLGRFGVQFVASPRHADGLLITGAVSRNMELALRKTYLAVAPPKIVIAVGACAISGGPFAGNPEILDGAGGVVPIDLYIPGCPPHPYTILDGILRALDKLGPVDEPARRERVGS